MMAPRTRLHLAALGSVALALLAGCKGIPTEDVTPDLRAEAILFSDDPLPKGAANTVTVRFSNQGSDTSRSFAVRLKIYAPGGGLVYTSDSAAGDARFTGDLDEGQIGSVTFNGVVDNSWSTGTYTFEAIVDVDDEVAELDETNNDTTAPADVSAKVSN